MRRAAQRRANQAPIPAPPLRSAAEKPLAAEVIPETPVGAGVSQHVQEYIDTGGFTQRSGQLGKEVTSEVSQMDEHMHEVFDHEVSRLAGRPGEAAAPLAVQDSPLPEDQQAGLPPLTAGGLAAMLGDPNSIRQIIVLNEILRRPEERWT
jgi:hypothetical protein